jgi:hypothetical protein
MITFIDFTNEYRRACNLPPIPVRQLARVKLNDMTQEGQCPRCKAKMHPVSYSFDVDKLVSLLKKEQGITISFREYRFVNENRL